MGQPRAGKRRVLVDMTIRVKRRLLTFGHTGLLTDNPTLPWLRNGKAMLYWLLADLRNDLVVICTKATARHWIY